MNTFEQEPDYDFVIVGARVAGAATARLLALAGAKVLVLDRGAFGSDTLSTSYLMRGAVQQLQRWDILPTLIAAGTPPVRTTNFHYADRTVAVGIRPSAGVDALYAPRRTLLDPLLVGAARAAGAEFRYGARVTGLLRRGDRVTGVELAASSTRSERVSAGMVIGADGLTSSVAHWVGAETYRTGKHSAPTIYSYFEGMPIDAYDWYYAHGMAAGAAPTNDRLSTVFVAAPAQRLPELHGDRHAGMLRIAAAVSPEFGAALADARRVSPLRVFPGLRGYYRNPVGPGWALVGDAGYFRDPCTAHGISDALRDAESLANAVLSDEAGALARYHAVRDQATERLFHASDEIASCQWDAARIEQLLGEATEGMRDGMQVVRGFDNIPDQAGGSINSAAHKRSIGVSVSRLAIRTDSRSGA